MYSPSLLEKWAKAHLLKYANKIENIHLNENSLFASVNLKLNVIIFLSFIIGIVLTIPIVYIDLMLDKGELFSKEFFINWSIVIFVIIFCSAIEIYLLYRIGFYAMYLLKKSVGLDLSETKDRFFLSFEDVLSRLVLEMAEPNIKIFGIDLDKHIDKRVEFFKIAIYKLKIILTNAIIKALIRKFFASNFLRVSIDYISAPVTGLWDAVVMYFIIKEAKFRISAYLFLKEYLRVNKNYFLNFSIEVKRVILMAIANAIVFNRHYHPNLQYLLLSFHKLFNINIENQILDDFELFKSKLKELKESERRVVLNIFIFALFLNGNFSKRKRKLLSEFDINLNEIFDKSYTTISALKSGDLQKAKESFLYQNYL